MRPRTCSRGTGACSRCAIGAARTACGPWGGPCRGYVVALAAPRGRVRPRADATPGIFRVPGGFVTTKRRARRSSGTRPPSRGRFGGLLGACEKLLGEFRNDSDVVVAQSREVALDAADYFGRASFAQEKAGHFNLAGALGDLAVAASGDWLCPASSPRPIHKGENMNLDLGGAASSLIFGRHLAAAVLDRLDERRFCLGAVRLISGSGRPPRPS